MLYKISIAKRTDPDECNGSNFLKFKDMVHGLTEESMHAGHQCHHLLCSSTV